MRCKIQEKPFTPNQKTLSPDTEKILDTMQNNFNESFVKSQNYSHENGGNNQTFKEQNFNNYQSGVNTENSPNNNYNHAQNGANTQNSGGLFSGLNSGGGIEKLLPLLMLMNRQNSVNSQSQNTGHEPLSNQNMNMFKLLSESGILGKNFSPDKLKLFEMLMNMNNLKNQSTTTSPTNKEQETKTTVNQNENLNNDIKKQNSETENFNETQEENEINNFEKHENKSVRE